MFSRNNRNGVVLDQVKEPALSRDLIQFVSTSTLNCPRFAPEKDIDSLTIDRIVNIAKRANVKDERDGKHLAFKLQRWKNQGIKALVCDAIDDEPYVSSQVNPLLHLSKEATGALKILAKALGASDYYIAVYKNMYDLNTKIPSSIENVRVVKLGGKYPMESRAAKALPRDHALIGTCALIHLYRAIMEGITQTTAIITVAGNCVGNPANLEVSLGMTLSMVLERCGLIKEPTHIVEGGAMKGLCVIDPEHTVIKADTRAVLAFRDDKKEQHYNCIGCGKCVEVCPVDLNPCMLYKMLSTNRMQSALKMGLEMCMGCSSCSYICPSRMDLSHLIFSEKRKLDNQEGEKEEIEA